MFNYAYIANSEKMTPEEYHWEYKNAEMNFRFFATSSMDMTENCAAKLADDGFECIDLCGDFDESKARKIAKAAGGRLEVYYAKYFEDEFEKIENLEDLSDYGIIIQAPGLEKGESVVQKIKSHEFNTTIVLVADENGAETAAQKLVEEGISFIELCSYYDAPKCSAVINAIHGKVPVGYCG